MKSAAAGYTLRVFRQAAVAYLRHHGLPRSRYRMKQTLAAGTLLSETCRDSINCKLSEGGGPHCGSCQKLQPGLNNFHAPVTSPQLPNHRHSYSYSFLWLVIPAFVFNQCLALCTKRRTHVQDSLRHPGPGNKMPPHLLTLRPKFQVQRAVASPRTAQL